MIAKPMFQRIKEEIENLLYPELRPYGRSNRDRLLREAAKTPLDLIECKRFSDRTALRA